MNVDLTWEELELLSDLLGEPEDSYGDPEHPARTAKEKLDTARFGP